MRRRKINEVYYWSLNGRERMKFKPEDGSFSWVKIGEYTDYTWSNKAMKNIPTVLSIEVNENSFEELEEIKRKSINKYLLTIDVTKNNLNNIHNNIIRFVGEDGREHGVSYLSEENVKLYNEYKNSPWHDIFFGYKADKEEFHKEFMNNLLKNGNKVVLYHYSNNKIENGYVFSTAQRANSYTPQSDIGYTYFWASKNRGRDISGGDYIYYCEVPIEDVYDYSSNLEGFKSQEEALEHYPYIAYYWADDDAIAVKTQTPTPISYMKVDNAHLHGIKESRIRRIVRESINKILKEK